MRLRLLRKAKETIVGEGSRTQEGRVPELVSVKPRAGIGEEKGLLRGESGEDFGEKTE